jgi:hypothetical protein
MVKGPHHSLCREPHECLPLTCYFLKILFNIILQSTFQHSKLSLTIALSDHMFLIHFVFFSCLLLVLSTSPSSNIRYQKQLGHVVVQLVETLHYKPITDRVIGIFFIDIILLATLWP